MPPIVRSLCLSFLLGLCLVPSLRAQTPRIWKSANGERTVEGEFVSLKGNQLTLKLKDGTTSTFAIEKLSGEDRQFAEEESRKPTTQLRDLLGGPGQAFDNVRFGMARDAFDAALSKSAHTQSVGGTDVEFFGQNVSFGDYLALIDGRSYKFHPLFEDEALTDLRFEGTPIDAAPDSTIRSRVGEIKALVVIAFGDPEESFEFPDVAALPKDAFGVTDSWNLPGGRKLYLAVSRVKEAKKLACTLRITAK